MVRLLHVCSMMCAVRFIVFLKSCVSCQALAQAVEQNSTLTVLYLRSNNIADEGAKAWCPVRMGSRGEKRSEEIAKAVRFSHVYMCLLPGLGRRPQTELHPDEAEYEFKQDRR